MKTLRDIFFLILGVLFIGFCLYVVLTRPAPAKYQDLNTQQEVSTTSHTLRVGDYLLPIEVLDTPEAREQGFSGRAKPLSGHGLLFVFEKSDVYGFWMKDMLFAIDIIWINENWQVINVERGVTPESFPKTYYPASPTRYVLELPTGDADLFNIDTGSKLYLDR